MLATYRRNGTVLLSPVWYEWRDGGFTVLTGENDIKARHLRRDPRASIVVAESVPPCRGIEVRTEAQVRRDGYREAVERVAIRYLGEEAGRSYADCAGDNLVIRLEPGELRAWDFADDFAYANV